MVQAYALGFSSHQKRPSVVLPWLVQLLLFVVFWTFGASNCCTFLTRSFAQPFRLEIQKNRHIFTPRLKVEAIHV